MRRILRISLLSAHFSRIFATNLAQEARRHSVEILDTYRYSSIDVARYVVAYANEHKYGINLTKMLKLSFFLYGAYLVYTGERLTDEHPLAWTYGPVFERARAHFMNYDLLNISLGEVGTDLKIDDDLRLMLEYTFKICGKHSASALVSWTHKEGSPWAITIAECKGREGGVIRDEVIYEFFDSRMYGSKEW